MLLVKVHLIQTCTQTHIVWFLFYTVVDRSNAAGVFFGCSWAEKRTEWKFQKTRQTWLLQHMFDSDKVKLSHLIEEFFSFQLRFRAQKVLTSESNLYVCDLRSLSSPFNIFHGKSEHFSLLMFLNCIPMWELQHTVYLIATFYMYFHICE